MIGYTQPKIITHFVDRDSCICFFSFLKKYEGEFVTFDDNPITLEGVAPREGRMIIFRFPSEQAAKAWYADEGYQSLSENRRKGTKLEFLTMVHGMPAR